MGARQFLQELYGDADRPATGKTRGGAREFMRSLPRSREDIYRNSTQGRDEIDGVAGVGFQFQRDLIRAAQRHSNGLGDVVRLALTAPEKVMGGVIGGVHGVLGGTDQMMADVLPENFGGRAYRQNAEANRHRAAEEQAAATRDLKTTLGRDVAGGLHSFGVTLPLTVGAMATKNPTLMYGGMGAQTGLTEYGTGRAAGLSPVHAAGYALNQGLIEAGTEKIPAGALVDAVKSNSPVASLVKAPLRYALGEGLGEQVATHGQDWVSGAYIDAMHNPNWMQDYQNSRWDAARSTAVSSAVVGMGNAGAAASVHSAQQGLAQLRQQPATGRAGEFLGRLFGEQKTVAPAAAAQPALAQQAAFVPPTVSQRDADALRVATELVRNIAAGGGMRTRQDVPTAAEAVGLGRPPAYRATANPGQVWHRGQNAVSGNAAITSTVNKIIGVESGGNANAKNPNSSATGLGQFISSTWLAMVRKYRPDVAAGKSEAQILALRTDPKLGREMTTRYVEENAAALRRAGQPVTEGNLYLAHFLGSGGALKLLGAVDKSQPVVNLVGQGVINANSFLRGKSVQWVIDWTARKMGGRAAGGAATSPAQSAYAQGSETAEAPLYGNAEHTSADNRQDDAAAEMEQAAAAQREAAEEMQDAARRMGRETKVYLDQQMRTARLVLMEADNLAPTMADAANQYRDRNRAVSEMQINQIANRLQPELLGDSMQADTGAPTLANDGRTIIGGNGRVLGIKRAYEQGGGEGYRQYLMDHAGQFGLSHEDVAAMRKPVLVRQLDESVDIAKAAVASNEGGGLGMSALEQARVDADRLADFGTLHVGEDGNLNTAANRGFIRDFVQGMPTTVQAQMMDAGGGLSQEGLRRLHNAILYRAYGNSPALSRMVESTDQGMRNMVNAMMQAAPKIAEAKEAIRSGHLHDADIAGDLVAAVEKLNQLRDGGQSVADYLAQQGLFDEDLSPVARDLVAFLEEHKRSAKAIATLLRNYYDALSAQGSPNQGDVFGDTAAPDKQQLLERTIDEYRQEHGKPSAGNDLFNDADGRSGIADRQAEPQSAGGRGDEAGAGEDAGGVGGQRESVSKDSGSLKFSRAVVEPVREAETFDEARAQAKAFQGKPLTNQDSGLVAVASRNSLDKMLSGKAVGKSVTPALHALAVANADKLYERAVYGWSKPDRSGDPNTVAIHRLFSVLDTEHGSYAVKLTVKETARSDQNNKLYTLEAVELNETSPAAQWVDSTVQADGLDPTSIRSVGDVKTLAQSTQHNKLYQGGADRVGFDTSAATHNRPTPTRSVEGAPDTNTTVRATPEEIKDLRQAVERAVGAANMRHIDLVSRADLVRPGHAEDLRGAEGWYDPKTRRITLIAEALPNARTAQFVAWHELGHRKMDVSGWQDWRNVLAQSRRNEVIDKLTQMIGRQRRQAGENITLDGETEEAAVELYAAMKNGDYEAIREKYGVTVPAAMREGLMGYFTRFARRLQEVLARVFGIKAQDFSDRQVFELLRGIDRAEEVSGSLNERETKFSLNEDADSDFARAVDEVAAGKVPAGYVSLGTTPEVLKLLGVPEGKVRISGGTIEKAMADYLNRQNTYDKNRHSIKPEDMKRLPANLNDPIAVFSSTTKADSFVVLTEILERENGRDKPVIAALHLDKGKYGMDLVNIASVYGRSDQQLVRAFNTDLLYLNKQKGRQFLKTHPLQLHWDITSDADLLKRNIKTNEDLAQDSGSLKLSRGNPLPDGGRKWFNEMGELNAGVAAYNKLADVIRPALAKVKMANDHPEAFTRYMRDYRAQLNVAGETAKEVAKAGIKITEAERKLLSDVLEMELPPGAEAAPELQELAAAMRAILNQQTDDLKALGMISPESAERFRDTYLPRFYNKQSGGLFDRSEFRRAMRGSMGKAIGGQHLKGRGIFKEVNRGEQAKYEAQGFELRQDYGNQGDKAGKVLMWRDYTKVERQQMGEERDAILRFTNGYIKTQADIAKGILFQRIATDADLASKTEVEGWTHVPDTAIAGTGGVKRYGALAGMWVHPEVAYHLQQQFYVDSVLQRVWRELLGWWKLGKTVYNAVAHVNNVMSNMVMLFVAGGRMRDVVPAALSIKHKDALYREALEQGLVGEAVDVAGLQEMFVGLNNASDDGIIMNTLVGRLLKRADKYTGRVASRAGKAMQTAYRVEDEVFKLALYRRGRERGLSPREAADYALTFMFDYSEVPQGVKWLRDTGTLPFVSYTYKALPALARATLTRPHRMLAVTGLMYGINAVSYALLGGEADEEEEREYMPDYQKGHTIFGTPKLIRMPWNDSKGKPVFLDVYRWLPLGDFADTQNQMGGLPIPQWMMPNGPVIGHISALVNNKDTFSGRELVKDYMSAGEKATIYGKWLAAQWLPASVGAPLSYHSNNVLDGLKNQFEDTKFAEVLEAMGYTGTNYRGEDKQLSRALLGAVGVKLRGEKVEDLKAARQRRVGAEVREVQADIRRISRDNTLTDSTKARRIQQRQAHLQKLFEQMPK